MTEFIGSIAKPPQAENDLTFVQISDSLMMSGDADAKWVDDYYAEVYKHMPGYVSLSITWNYHRPRPSRSVRNRNF